MKNIKIAKTPACSKSFLYGGDFNAALAIFGSYCYSAKAPDAVEKIAAD